MICPKCGYDMGDSKSCEKCGYVFENEEENVQNTEVLEDISVDFDETDVSEIENEDEVKASDDDLVIDFDQIDESKNKKSKKNSGTWLVALVSFVAGALASLIVISCINGTFMSFFDKTVNGNPKEVLNSYIKTSFETFSTKEYTKECSIYYRNSIVSQLKQYKEQGYPIDVDMSLDITKDSNFEKIAKIWLQGNASYKFNILNIDATDIKYYKSGSDEYKEYMKNYKSSETDKVAEYSKNATMFAKVTFSMNYSIKPIEQTTTTATTTTAKNDNKKAETTGKTKSTTTTTTKITTQTSTKATTSKGAASGSMICVKENGSWKVFNDISWVQ